MKLFTLLSKMKDFDGDKVDKAIYRDAKLHLQRELIRSLAVFHAETAPDDKVRSVIGRAQVLIDKGEPMGALKMLDSAKKLAYKYDLFGQVYEVIKKEMRIAAVYGSQIELNLNLLASEKAKIKRMMEDEGHHEDRFFRAVQVTFRGYNISKADFKELEELAQPTQEAVTYLGKVYYHRIKGYYYAYKGDYSQSRKHIEKAIEIFESKPAKLKENVDLYTGTVVQSIRAFTPRDLEARLQKIQEAKKIKAHSYYYRACKFQNLEFNELFILMNLKRFDEAYALQKGIVEGLTIFEPVIFEQRKVSIYCNLMVLNLIKEDWATVIDFSHRVLNIKSDRKPDTYRLIRLIQVIAYLEQFSEFSAANIHRGHSYYFGAAANKFERMCYEYLGKIIDGKPAHKQFWRALRDSDSRQLGVPEMMSWAASKWRKGNVEEYIAKYA